MTSGSSLVSSRMTAPNGDIDPGVAKKAELFECYCGHPLIITDVALCSECGKVPEKCDCHERE